MGCNRGSEQTTEVVVCFGGLVDNYVQINAFGDGTITARSSYGELQEEAINIFNKSIR